TPGTGGWRCTASPGGPGCRSTTATASSCSGPSPPIPRRRVTRGCAPGAARTGRTSGPGAGRTAEACCGGWARRAASALATAGDGPGVLLEAQLARRIVEVAPLAVRPDGDDPGPARERPALFLQLAAVAGLLGRFARGLGRFGLGLGALLAALLEGHGLVLVGGRRGGGLRGAGRAGARRGWSRRAGRDRAGNARHGVGGRRWRLRAAQDAFGGDAGRGRHVGIVHAAAFVAPLVLGLGHAGEAGQQQDETGESKRHRGLHGPGGPAILPQRRGGFRAMRAGGRGRPMGGGATNASV